MGVMFPGGGTQYIGMGKMLFREFPMAVQLFEQAEDMLSLNLRKICLEGPFDRLSSMEVSQPAIYVFGIASFKFLSDRIGRFPDFAAGHSLGEYAALTSAGAIRFQDGIQLVGARGRILQQAGQVDQYAMLAVNKIGEDRITETCNTISPDNKLYIAVFNSPHQHVVTGRQDLIYQLRNELEKQQADVTILHISSPSHSILMNAAAIQLQQELIKYAYNPLAFEVISNVSTKPYQGVNDIVSTLTEHMVSPVQWANSVRYMTEHGASTLIDIGPQLVLKNLVPFISKGILALGMEQPDDVTQLKDLLVRPNKSTTQFLNQCLVMAASTPNYAPAGRNQREISDAYRALVQFKEGVNGWTDQAYRDKGYEVSKQMLVYKETPEDLQREALERLVSVEQ